jgi:FdhD protein
MSQTHKATIERFPDGERAEDLVAVEEPLQIHVNGKALAVLMRTPGLDRPLTAGFLLSEGVIDGPDDLSGIELCANPDREDRHNLIFVELAPGCDPPDESLARSSYASTSCGVCGKTSIDNLLERCYAHPAFSLIPELLIRTAGERALEHQQCFKTTGGIHAAALFDLTSDTLVAFAEDVGRHNAVDKVLGNRLLADRLPLGGHVLWVSGRTSFEVVQKALSAGVPGLISVGAPTSLAVELAQSCRMSLVGFARGRERYNIYAGPGIPDEVDRAE